MTMSAALHGRGQSVRNRATTRPTDHPPMPREHGAWGILLIPFATAACISRTASAPVLLLLVSVLCFYVARTSYLKKNFTWMALLLFGSCAAAAPLLLWWHLWWLCAFGGVGAVLAFRPTQRDVVNEVVAVGGLTLTGPAAWYAASGRLDHMAFLIWALNTLYFVGGVLYVKLHIAAAIRRREFDGIGERFGFAWLTLAWYSVVLAVLVSTAFQGWIPFAAVAAFAPTILRAIHGAARLSPRLRIKRIGWTEAGWSVVFGVLLVIALQGWH